jgi:hypothetical protein
MGLLGVRCYLSANGIRTPNPLLAKQVKRFPNSLALLLKHFPSCGIGGVFPVSRQAAGLNHVCP